jgi:phenylpropionate dioxygenase-like ring-hydroxylating dioxygenase large terminal subunit
MFLRNCWYVAAHDRDIGRSLTPTTILDERIVLFRTSDGTPVALEDACPHRKLPLSKGRLHDATVECGYHGLTFDCTGRCVAAPTQGNIPPSAKVRAYPLVERHGMIWIWMGEPSLADPAAVFTVPNYDDPAWGRTRGGVMELDCNYLYVTDNLLDPAHVAWVHVSSFAGAGTESQPLKVDVSETGVVVWRWMMDRAPPPYYAPMLRFAGNCDRLQHYEVVFPSIAINKSIFTPAGTGGSTDSLDPRAFVNISYNFITPISATRSRYFWFQHRNTDPLDAEITRRMDEGALAAFLEDRDILNAVQIGMDEARTPHLDLGLDAGALRFRRALQRRIEAEGNAARGGASSD